MKCKMYVIPITGEPIISEVEFKENVPTIRELRALVGPEIPSLNDPHAAERVNVWFGEKYTDMFVDEVGIEKGLPRNERATEIYRANWLRAHPKDDPESLPHVAGVAVVFDARVWF